jgi:hypothetical protein
LMKPLFAVSDIWIFQKSWVTRFELFSSEVQNISWIVLCFH